MILVPNALESDWLDRGERVGATKRPIDVIVQSRKSSHYVNNQLVPALRKEGLIVKVQEGWIKDLVALFNQSTVYLYDSADYWRGRGVSEGFGLPPVEAMACGCVVFSSINHALADHAISGRTLHQIGCGRLDFDIQRIQAAVADPEVWRPSYENLQSLLDAYSEESSRLHWFEALAQIDAIHLCSGPQLRRPHGWLLRLDVWRQRVRRVANRLLDWPQNRKFDLNTFLNASHCHMKSPYGK